MALERACGSVTGTGDAAGGTAGGSLPLPPLIMPPHLPYGSGVLLPPPPDEPVAENAVSGSETGGRGLEGGGDGGSPAKRRRRSDGSAEATAATAQDPAPPAPPPAAGAPVGHTRSATRHFLPPLVRGPVGAGAGLSGAPRA